MAKLIPERASETENQDQMLKRLEAADPEDIEWTWVYYEGKPWNDFKGKLALQHFKNKKTITFVLGTETRIVAYAAVLITLAQLVLQIWPWPWSNANEHTISVGAITVTWDSAWIPAFK